MVSHQEASSTRQMSTWLLLNPTKGLPSSRGVCFRTQDSLVHLRKSVRDTN
jgi:hypothetical protein